MFLQQGEGWFQVGGFAEPPARGARVGVAAAELNPVGANDPVQQPTGVIDAGVGAHQIEDGPGVLDQVVGQASSTGEGVGTDRLGPAVAQVVGEVEQGGQAAGGAGELGRPAGQMGQVAAAGGQPRLQVALERQQQLPRRLVQRKQSRALAVGAGRDGQAGS